MWPPLGHSMITFSLDRSITGGSPLAVNRETRLRQRFSAAHPDVPTVVVPALSTDVHDLDGLRAVGALLAGD